MNCIICAGHCICRPAPTLTAFLLVTAVALYYEGSNSGDCRDRILCDGLVVVLPPFSANRDLHIRTKMHAAESSGAVDADAGEMRAGFRTSGDSRRAMLPR